MIQVIPDDKYLFAVTGFYSFCSIVFSVYQMLALAVLDRILSIDRQNQWLVYICNSGYLQSLVESLRQDDAALQNLLMPQPPLLKPLYIYESKMVRHCKSCLLLLG